jgi:dTDP-4-dehydrorhamnose 3,5-epimerase
VIFRETKVAGAFLLLPQRSEDSRGSFARMFCREELMAHGLDGHVEQTSLSVNTHAGTLRGMHYAVAPAAEAKTVWCVQGSIHDVILDLRPGSPTYRQWDAAPLSSANACSLYIPPGVAHGFLTLEPDSHVWYAMNVAFVAECARGVRWDDPAFAIDWPGTPAVISERDATYALHPAG